MLCFPPRLPSLIVALALAGSSGCSPSHMAVPPEVSEQAEVLPVTDRSVFRGAWANESFTLGPYRVSGVDRDWNSSSGFEAGPYSKNETTGGYSFKHRAGESVSKGKCSTGSGSQEVEVGIGSGFSVGDEFGEYSRLTCTCEPGTEVHVETRGEEYTGFLQLGDQRFDVRSISGGVVEVLSGQPVGYRIDGPQEHHAVEVVPPGRVWLARSIDEDARRRLTCLLAGLLLHMP